MSPLKKCGLIDVRGKFIHIIDIDASRDLGCA